MRPTSARIVLAGPETDEWYRATVARRACGWWVLGKHWCHTPEYSAVVALRYVEYLALEQLLGSQASIMGSHSQKSPPGLGMGHMDYFTSADLDAGRTGICELQTVWYYSSPRTGARSPPPCHK
jgi:hypothetical protein